MLSSGLFEVTLVTLRTWKESLISDNLKNAFNLFSVFKKTFLPTRSKSLKLRTCLSKFHFVQNAFMWMAIYPDRVSIQYNKNFYEGSLK